MTEHKVYYIDNYGAIADGQTECFPNLENIKRDIGNNKSVIFGADANLQF